MKRLLHALALLVIPIAFAASSTRAPEPQSRPRTVKSNDAQPPSKDAAEVVNSDEVVKTDVDLVVLDALILQKKTGRVVGGLKPEDFALTEDGVAQKITHFGQDRMPLSVIILIDRGGCLDPYSENVRHAARDAVSRLKPSDEVALMAYHDSVDLVEGFTRDRQRVSDALDRVPGHDEHANHCLNKAFFEAAYYMQKAGNPVSRRVIILITAVTSNFDCPDGPSGAAAKREVFESGSVVCGVIPKSAGQRMESGMMRTMTGVAKVFRVSTLRINELAEETGGEVLDDKPENLDKTFNTLVEHLRTRYQLGYVPTNRTHDGTTRKLRLKVSPAVEKSQGKLAVKTRRSYVAKRG